MKKSILIGVLAALMLFAFTACEGGTASVDYIRDVYATQVTETAYLPGETVSLSDYTFTALMYDGRTKDVAASDIVFDSLVVPADAKETDKITGKYKGSDISVELDFNLATVGSVTIDADDVTVKEYIEAVSANDSKDEYKDKSLDLTGLQFTVKYTDENEVAGEKTFAYSDIDSKAVTAGFKSGSTWELTAVEVEAGSASRTVAVKYANVDAGEYTVTLVPNYIKELELKATDGYKVYRNATTNNKLAYDDTKAKGVYMEATWDNGETSVVPKVQVVYVGENNATIINIETITIPPTGSSVSLTAKYIPASDAASELGIGVSDTAAALNVDVADESIIDLTFTNIPATLEQGDYTKEKIAADFTVKPVYASGSTASTPLDYTSTGDGYVFTAPADLDLTEAALGRTEFTVKATVGTLTFEKSFTTVIVEADGE